MINLRYHIVSITAVFLALGIGLTLGSTFLDRVTVDTLENQLSTVQADVERTEAENAALRDRVDALEGRDAELRDEVSGRLVAGRLTDVPILVVATEGTDQTLVDQATEALQGGGADLVGTWWLTSRWLLDDPEEVRDLTDVLELRTDDVDRLRRNGAIRLADALLAATEAPPRPTGEDPDDGDPTTSTTIEGGEPGTTTETSLGAEGPVAEAQPQEPEVAAALADRGFLEYASPPGGSGPVLLPPEGLRVVVVAGTAPDSGGHQLALGLLAELTAERTVPVVAAQGAVEVADGDGDPAPESEQRSTFVGPLREGDLTRDRLSTIDDLDAAAGLLALVLAVEDAGVLHVGHYGVGPGAASLLPEP